MRVIFQPKREGSVSELTAMQKIAVVLPSGVEFSNPVVNGAGLQQIEVDLSCLICHYYRLVDPYDGASFSCFYDDPYWRGLLVPRADKPWKVRFSKATLRYIIDSIEEFSGFIRD